MMRMDYESASFELFYDSLYGVGYIRRKADGAETLLITGTDMVDLRCFINRARTNATSRKKNYRPAPEIVDGLLDEYFPDIR